MRITLKNWRVYICPRIHGIRFQRKEKKSADYYVEVDEAVFLFELKNQDYLDWEQNSKCRMLGRLIYFITGT